jgi:hypothetical protein
LKNGVMLKTREASLEEGEVKEKRREGRESK